MSHGETMSVERSVLGAEEAINDWSGKLDIS